MAASKIVSQEDYNIRSEERTKILEDIKHCLKDEAVSPIFWVCCQVGVEATKYERWRWDTTQWCMLSQESTMSLCSRRRESPSQGEGV